jgi:hypothetical protein
VVIAQRERGQDQRRCDPPVGKQPISGATGFHGQMPPTLVLHNLKAHLSVSRPAGRRRRQKLSGAALRNSIPIKPAAGLRTGMKDLLAEVGQQNRPPAANQWEVCSGFSSSAGVRDV